jgi:hypothetical protein
MFTRSLLSVTAASFMLASGLIGTALMAAEPTKKDVLIASRALNFVTPKPGGSVVAAIVFDGSNPASKADADALAAIIGDGLKAGKIKLSAKLVDANDLASIGDAKLAIIAASASAQHAAIASGLAGKSILTVSTDLSCVEAGHCAVGVKSKPKVEIIVNKSAAKGLGLDFVPAFLLMVKEV